MSDKAKSQLSKVLRVFISSSTSEMQPYREKAIEAIEAAGMRYTNYNEPTGSSSNQGNKTIFEVNHDGVVESDVFLGLYGFKDVWRPASSQDLRYEHPELNDDPDKLIMEYEYEWAMEAKLYIFRFLRTPSTSGVEPANEDRRMAQFRSRLQARSVGWLSTPTEFYNLFLARLIGIKPRIFLSYSRKNTEYASNLQQKLRGDDLHVWRDATNIPGSADWKNELDTALNLMDVLLLVATSESLESEYVTQECKFFLNAGKPIVIYIVDESIKKSLPDYLSKIQYIDGTDQSGYLNLIKQLRILLERT